MASPYTKPPHPTSLRRGLLSLFDTVTICVQSLHDKMLDEHHYQTNLRVRSTCERLSFWSISMVCQKVLVTHQRGTLSLKTVFFYCSKSSTKNAIFLNILKIKQFF
jgi:hypothetical protein